MATIKTHATVALEQFMSRRTRELIESIIFAGMKPGAPVGRPHPMRWLQPLLRPIERFLSGGAAPSDPLYLSRRTTGQRIRFALLIGTPGVIVTGLMALALSNNFVKKTVMPRLDLPPAEVAAKMLPNMDRVKLDTNRDVDVMEVHVDRTRGTVVMGTVMNNTAHQIHSAEIVFDLTDAMGSQLGGVSQKIENLPPQNRQAFRLPIEQRTASLVLLREVKTR
jgi:hypothetical protein